MTRRLPLFEDALRSRNMPAVLSALAADFRDESFLNCMEALGYDRDYSQAAWLEVTASKAIDALECEFAHRSVICVPDDEPMDVPEIDMAAARKKWIDLRSLQKPKPPPATGLCGALLDRAWEVCVLTKSDGLLNLQLPDRSADSLEYTGLFDRWYQNRRRLTRIRRESRPPARPVDVVIAYGLPQSARGLQSLPMAEDVLVFMKGHVHRAVEFLDFVTDGPRAWDKADEVVGERLNDRSLRRLRGLSGDADLDARPICPTRAELNLFDILSSGTIRYLEADPRQSVQADRGARSPRLLGERTSAAASNERAGGIRGRRQTYA